MTASEFREIYLFAIDYRDENGNLYSDEMIEYHILNAQESIEDFLSIKIFPQIISETLDYNAGDFGNWNYLRTSYFVRKAFELTGFIGSDNRQIDYPSPWLTARRTNDSSIGYERAINLVPNGTDNVEFSSSATYSALYPFFGYSTSHIPEYWQVVYTTGFDVIPRDILSAVGKMAAIDALNVLGDAGALGSGIASQSISIDGLSQSQSSTASATSAANTARVLQYTKELDKELNSLRDKYLGVAWASL